MTIQTPIQMREIKIITDSRCVDLLDFAKKNSWFNADFIESVANQIRIKDTVTTKQAGAIQKMHLKFCKD